MYLPPSSIEALCVYSFGEYCHLFQPKSVSGMILLNPMVSLNQTLPVLAPSGLPLSGAIICPPCDFCHRGSQAAGIQWSIQSIWRSLSYPLTSTEPSLVASMDVFGTSLSFIFLIFANYGTKIYEWEDLKDPDFAYSSLEVFLDALASLRPMMDSGWLIGWLGHVFEIASIGPSIVPNC